MDGLLADAHEAQILHGRFGARGAAGGLQTARKLEAFEL